MQIREKTEEFSKDKSRKDGYNNRCKTCAGIECKTYKLNHEEYTSEYNKKYKEDHKEEIAKRMIEYEKERRKVDLQYRIARNLRKRLHHALNGHTKSETTKDLLRIDFNKFAKWIEYQLPI